MVSYKIWQYFNKVLIYVCHHRGGNCVLIHLQRGFGHQRGFAKMGNTIDSLPEGLPEQQARRLAELHGASRTAIGETLALWPLDSRQLLARLNVIDYDLGEDTAEHGGHLRLEDVADAARHGVPMDFGVTDYGLQLIELCARTVASE
jgi:hypothetical protein